MARGRTQYIDDQQRWPDDKVYRWKRCKGVAVRVYGWEAEPDIELGNEDNGGEDYWDGESMRSTGRIVVVMVGDDYRHIADPEDVEEIAEEDYCSSCGQIGCGHSLKGE
jgi:hypothetical protein